MFDIEAYENAAEFVKAISHEKRLQLIELLKTQERCVEELTASMGVGFKSVSAHLRVMKKQGILATRKDGKRVYYRLRNSEILELFKHICEVALVEAQVTPAGDQQLNLTLRELLNVIEAQQPLLIDVRSHIDFSRGHIPGSLSVPINELTAWSENYHSDGRLIVVYCEGFYCIQSIQAIKILLAKGCDVKMYRNGLTEWSAAGYDVSIN